MRKLVMAMMVFCAAGGVVKEVSGQEEPTALIGSLQSRTRELEPEIYFYKYEEPGPGLEWTGTFFGLSTTVTKRAWVDAVKEGQEVGTKRMQRFDARFAFGIVDYEGYYFDGTPATIEGINDFVLEVRGLLGADFLKQTNMFTLYAGIGGRYLNDDFQYRRQSAYLYLPLGMETTRNLTGGWTVTANTELDVLLYGRQYSDLSEFGLGEVENTQDSGYGIRASVKFQKHGKKTDFIFEPFIRYWNIDDSDVVNGIYEPQNETLEGGIKFGWLF